MTTRPNPGSDEARRQGCTCPVLDNAHGQGYYGVEGQFVMVEDCPLHGPEAQAIIRDQQATIRLDNCLLTITCPDCGVIRECTLKEARTWKEIYCDGCKKVLRLKADDDKDKRGMYKLTEEECSRIGGHCYVIEPFLLATNPPISTRLCKHCGHRQRSKPHREDDFWQDVSQ